MSWTGMDPSLSFGSLLPLLQGVFGAGLAFLVIRGHRRSRTHVLFALFLLDVGLWGLMTFLMRRSGTAEEALFWEKGLVPLGPMIGLLFLLFTARSTHWRLRRWIPALLGAACLLFLPAAFTDLVFSGMHRETGGWAADPGLLFPPWLAFCAALAAAALLRILVAERSADDAEERNRLRYVLSGVAAVLLGGVLDVVPVAGLTAYPGIVLGSLAFLVLTALAILRHDLLDIRRILREILAFLLAAVLLASVPAAVLAVSELLGGSVRLTPVTLLLCLAFSLALPPLWLAVRRRTGRWIHGSRLESLEALGRFAREAQSLVGEDPGPTLLRLFAAALRTERALLFLPDAGAARFVLHGAGVPSLPAGTPLTGADSPFARWLHAGGEAVFLRDLPFLPCIQHVVDGEQEVLRRLDAELLVPLSVRGERLCGILVVCRRAGGRLLDVGDRDLASSLSGQMAVKLENIRLYREALEGGRTAQKPLA